MILEKKSGVLLIAGLAFFAIAFLSNAVVPLMMYRHLPEKTAEQLVNGNLRYQFEDLARRYPESFQAAFGPTPEGTRRDAWLNQKCADALRMGRDVYIAEGCWHCHSQFVRPVSNEDRRFGPVSKSWEYSNELQRPVMFGTRRVGPDLSREGGRRGNDWHALHFFRPRSTSPESVMPDYPWFFESADASEAIDADGKRKTVRGPTAPNKRGFAIVTYMQWLGSYLDDYGHYETGP